MKHVRVFEEGPQQGNEGERRVKDRQKERGTRVVRISFFVLLSLSLSLLHPHSTERMERRKQSERKDGESAVCVRERVLSEEYAYREGR